MDKIKLLFAAFAALIVCSSAWGRHGDCYMVYTKAQLKEALLDDPSANIDIMADIDMEGEGSITTQFMDDDHEFPRSFFHGMIYGNNHTISNCPKLFECLGSEYSYSEIVIKDLRIVPPPGTKTGRSYMRPNKSDFSDEGVGVLAGWIEGNNPVTISNVHVLNADVDIGNSWVPAGGLIGKVVSRAGLTVRDCSVSGKAENNGSCGGLIGVISQCYGLLITNCTADVAICGRSDAGGLIGELSALLNAAEIVDCTALGEVNGPCAGGFIGSSTGQTADYRGWKDSGQGTIYDPREVVSFDWETLYVHFDRCRAAGRVNFSLNGYLTRSGGFVGKAANNPAFRQCFALGDVFGNYRGGGFAGEVELATFNDCFALGDIVASGVSGAFLGLLEGAGDGVVSNEIRRIYAAGQRYRSDEPNAFEPAPLLRTDNSVGSLITNAVGGTYATFTNAANFADFLAARDAKGNAIWAMEAKTMPYLVSSLKDGKFVTYLDDGTGKLTEELTARGQLTAGSETFASGYGLVQYIDSLPYANRTVSSVHIADNHRRPRVVAGRAIASAADFQNITNNLSESCVLVNNIQIKNDAFVPIGTTGHPFVGSFYGRGHQIDLRVTDGRDNLALFGLVGGNATLRDVTVAATLGGGTNVAALAAVVDGGSLVNCHAADLNLTASGSVGGLVGRLNAGSVKNCSAAGSIVSTGAAAGGLVGFASGGSTITDSSAAVTVSGIASDAGGFIGRSENTFAKRSAITRCFAAGGVAGLTRVGGFVGSVREVDLDECFALGGATGADASVGGFVGAATSATLCDAYALGDVCGTSSVGGFIGATDADVEITRAYCENNFTATGASGVFKGSGAGSLVDCIAAVGNHAKMTTAATFANFLSVKNASDELIWTMTDGQTEPYFAWSLQNGGFAQYYDGRIRKTAVPGAAYTLAPAPGFGQTFAEWTDSSPYPDTYDPSTTGIRAENHRAHTYRTGTPITTAAQLRAIAMSGTYVIMNDIDTTDADWTPLGNVTPFTGEVIGNGCAVTIRVPSGTQNAGLFAHVEGAHLKGIVVRGSVAAQGTAGALVGVVTTPLGAAARIEECRSEANVTCSGDKAGGLIGRLHPGASARLYRCWTSGAVSGASEVGGLVGMMEGGEIVESFAVGRVTGSGDRVGGLVGFADTGTMTDCYAIGRARGASAVGGLVGSAANAVSLTRVYCEQAPLVGTGSPAQTACVCGNGDYGFLTDTANFAAFLANGNWTMLNGLTEPYFTWSRVGASGNAFAMYVDGVRHDVLPGATAVITAAVPSGKAVLFWDNGEGALVEDNRLTTARFRALNHSSLHYSTATAISTRGDLMAVDNLHSPYVLTNDLDISNYEWQPLFGEGTYFSGCFEGHGHTLALKHTGNIGNNGTGLFGYLGSGAAISNLVLTGEFRGHGNVGALAGKTATASGPVSICNVFASNVVIHSTSDCAGGLLGSVRGKLTVVDSAVEGTITTQAGAGENIGGFVGKVGTDAEASFTRCRAVAAVSGNRLVGGFAGSAYAGSFSQCFAVGTVRSEGTSAGGFVGFANAVSSFTDSYAVAEVSGSGSSGAFAGTTPGSSVRCYGYRPGVDDYAAMTNAANWTALLAQDCWAMTDGRTMPYLKWSVPDGRFTTYSRLVNQKAEIGADYTLAIPLDPDECFVRWLGGYEFNDLLDGATSLRADNFRYLDYTIGTMVRTVAELESVSTRSRERPYVLMNDLDLTAAPYTPIGHSVKAKFSGEFLGGGHVLTVAGPVFRYISDATIENVVLTGTISNCTDDLNAALVAHASGLDTTTNYINRCVASNLTIVARGEKVGALIGEVTETGRTVVENCRVIAEITGAATEVGGLVGKVSNSVSRFYRNAVYAHLDVALPDGKTDNVVGGFAGDAGAATYEQCYVIGSVKGAGNKVAGFAASAPDAHVTDCYAYADVSGPADATTDFVDDENEHAYLTRTYGYNPRTATNYATMTNAANWTAFLARDCWAMTDGKTMPYLTWSVTDNKFDLYDRAHLFRQTVGETTPYAAHPPAGRGFVAWTSGLSYDAPLAVEARELADNHRYPTYRTGRALTSAAELRDMDGSEDAWVVLADIDARDADWTPLFAAAEPFVGEFHGRGHTISLAGTTSASDCGLFAAVSNAWIRDITLVGSLLGGDRTGALVGSVRGETTISNVTSTVFVNGAARTGGLVGEVNGTVDFADCTVNAPVTATGSSVGGLVGVSEGAASYVRCRALDDVTGENFTGGFIGSLTGGTVSECYALGRANGSQSVGGFAGELQSCAVADAYALGEVTAGDYSGGFAGVVGSDATVTRAYCEKGEFADPNESTGTLTACVTGEGQPEILTNQSAMAAFTAPVWTMTDGKTMPHFAWSLDADGFDFYCNRQVNRVARGAVAEVREDAPTTVALAEWTDDLPFGDPLEPVTTLYAANHRRLHYRTGIALRTKSDFAAMSDPNAAYVLVTDLSCGGVPSGLGDATPFCGELFGRHRTISNPSAAGLFAAVSNAVIRRVTISGGGTGCAFAHQALGTSTFVDCSTSMRVVPLASPCGGFVDIVPEGASPRFERCAVYSRFLCSGTPEEIGGFVGRAFGGTFRECFAISSIDTLGGTIGGFVGAAGATAFTDCYALGDITSVGVGGAFAGTVTADTRLTRVYADGATSHRVGERRVELPANRFVGNDAAGTLAKYVDTVYRDGDYAKMTNAVTFAAFLANGNWSMIDGGTLPYFAWSLQDGCFRFDVNERRTTVDPGFHAHVIEASERELLGFIRWFGSAIYEDVFAATTRVPCDNHRNLYAKWGDFVGDETELAAIRPGVNFVLTNDIVCTSVVVRIGSEANPYWGEVDGRGHTVRLKPADGSPAPGGLFAAVSDATVRNLTVEGLVSGGDGTGGFVDHVSTNSFFSRCASYVEVLSDGAGVGGFVGRAEGGCRFDACFAVSPVYGLGRQAGGFVGTAEAAIFADCYSTGDVTARSTAGAFAGAIGAETTLTRVYSDGTVSLSTGRRVVTRDDRLVGAADPAATQTDVVYRTGDSAYMTDTSTFVNFLSARETQTVGGAPLPYVTTSAVLNVSGPTRSAQLWKMEGLQTMPYFAWSLKDGKFVCYEHTGSTNVTRGTAFGFTATPYPGRAFTRWLGGFDFDDACAIRTRVEMNNHRHPHYRTGAQVSDAADLAAVANDGDYVLMRSVYVTANDAYAVGADAFAGEFHGRGNAIILYDAGVPGIFRNVSGGWIRDVIVEGQVTGRAGLVEAVSPSAADETLIENCRVRDLTLTALASDAGTGGLIGSVAADTELVVSNCTVAGMLRLTDGVSSVGGFVGSLASSDARLFRNASTVEILGDTATGTLATGGFVGAFAAGMIDEAYAVGPVTAKNGDGLGAFAGALGAGAVLRDAYALGEVMGGAEATSVGTFAGSVADGATVARVYSDGLAWRDSPKRHKPAVTNFFGTGATANLGAWVQRTGSYAPMTNAANFASFLHYGNWTMTDGATEPYFAWSLRNGRFALTQNGAGDIRLPDDGTVEPGETAEIVGADFTPAGSSETTAHAEWLYDAPFESLYAPTGRLAGINHRFLSAKYGVAVSNAAQLAAINNTRSVYVITHPIVAPSFAPLTASTSAAFSGELYGRRHLLSITNSASGYPSYQGLFGYAGGSMMRDVVVSGTINGYVYTGGLVGMVRLIDLNPTELINCSTTNLTIAAPTTGIEIGGLVGSLVRDTKTVTEELFVTNCTTHGVIRRREGSSVSNLNRVGGMIGSIGDGFGTFVDSEANVALQVCGQYQGGFVGSFNDAAPRGSFFVNCMARGDVYGGVYSYVGGFAGYSQGYSQTNVFVNCSAYGDVEGYLSCGGFMGHAPGAFDFHNCSAYGNVVSSGQDVGGFVGCAWSDKANVPQHFYRCRAVGTVGGTATGGYRGGFAGTAGWTFPVYEECYALGDVAGGDHVGGFAGRAAAAFTNCYALGSVRGEKPEKGGFAGTWDSTARGVRCYSAGRVTGSSSSIGGFMGSKYYTYSNVDVTNCVWQTYGDGLNDTGHENLPGRIAQQTYAGMTNAANWAAFLADDAWAMADGRTMPYLKWSAPDGRLSLYTDEHCSKVGGGTIAVSDTSPAGGTTVTLTATPDDESFFHHWAGFGGADDLPRPSDATVTIPVDNHRIVSAHYGVYIDDVDEFKAMTDEPRGIYQLRADLDLQGESWSPLFRDVDGERFTGIFYGANHVIDNLACTNPAAGFYPSLLGTLSGAEVHDLTVRGRVDVTQNNNSGCGGGLVGKSDASFFTNCVAEVTVANLSKNINTVCGGFAGRADGSRFVDCRATGDVQAKGSSNVGGFCGTTSYQSPSAFTRCTALGDVCGGTYVGGFSGKGGGSAFIGCRADGFVWGTDRYVGGLIGYAELASGGATTSPVVDSFARGDVRGGGSYIGGLIGCNYVVVSNCWSSGVVWGYGGVCALVGENHSLVTNSFYRLKSGQRVAAKNYNSGCRAYVAPMDETEFAVRVEGLPVHHERVEAATPIATVDELLAITNDLEGTYKLVADLDLRKLRRWSPFGTSAKAFTGEFYGQGHSISNFHVLATNVADLAFFGRTSAVRIEGLKLYGKVEQVVTNATAHYTGGLASRIEQGSLVRECAFVGDVNVKIDDTVTSKVNAYTGLFAGQIQADTALIERCATVGFLSLDGNGGYIGGFAGYLGREGRYFDCYSFVSITNCLNEVGGFTYYVDSSTSLSNCWCYGRVHDPNYSSVSYVGGFQGFGNGSRQNCYMNSEAAAPYLAGGGYHSRGSDLSGVGYLSSNDFTVASSFVGYDFDGIWAQGAAAPYLRCLGELTYVEAVSLFGYSLWAAENGFPDDRDGTTDGVANLFRYAFDRPTGSFSVFSSFAPTPGGATIVTPPVVNTEDVVLKVASTDDLKNWDPSYAGFRFYDLPPSGELTIDDLPHPDDNRFFRLTAE